VRRSGGRAGTIAGFVGLAVGIVGSAVLCGAPATAAPGDPPPIGTIGLLPTHGPPNGPILATYHLSLMHLAPIPARCPARADFAFDNVPAGSAPFLPGNATCIATLKLVPPPNTPAGHHYVSVKASDGVHGASSLYVVDPGASPTASPSPSPKPSRSSPSPTPSRSRATPSAMPSVEDPLPAPETSDPVLPGTISTPAAAPGTTTSAGPWLVVALVFGGLLVLGGLLILGLLVYHHHRAARPAGPPGDAPTLEFPRQPMPEG
jgi:hypothetical protein